MAFHQPTRQAAQRVLRPTFDEGEARIPSRAPSQGVDESQTWVLFPPATDAETTTSYLTPSHKSNDTRGRTRPSELGSLDTLVRSEGGTDQQRSSSFIDAIDDEDDAELDSLDSHLPEFRSTPDLYNSSTHPHATPVVPAHDGLGSFRLDQDGGANDIQDRLYAFEQYNPRRVKRRRESLELAQTELENEESRQVNEKMQRIENWRLEQSRVLLEEIQKETRRRRRSNASIPSAHPIMREAEELAASIPASEFQGDKTDPSDEWHEQAPSDMGAEREQESAWGRITKVVVRDLLGIDDKTLAVLVGEALPDDDELSSTPKASALNRPSRDQELMESSAESGWQVRMLERVAKELGLLVHRLSEHPGAFSTFTRMQQMPLPYAGLPSIPEATNVPTASTVADDASRRVPEFQPTIGTQTKPIDVPQRRMSQGSLSANAHPQSETHTAATFTQEEWEQDLDIRLVFRYLRSRFMSRSTTTAGHGTSSHLSTSSTQDTAAKIARVRQHHPLVARARPVERRNFKATTPSSPVLFRPASSCASQSTRKSVRRSSVSSRHYWDIGGSVGTSSVIAPTGPMGSWGEV